MSYDYMVLAGTQGMKNHDKKDRMFEIASTTNCDRAVCRRRWQGVPVTLTVPVWRVLIAGHSLILHVCPGWCPWLVLLPVDVLRVNAVLLGCCDVIIATEGSNIGIGGLSYD